MSDAATHPAGRNPQDLQAEIIRLNKIILALMNRAERAMSGQGSDFGLFETAVRLEEEVQRRTEQWEKTLRENERINHALQQTQRQMEEEIVERKRIEEALRQANQQLETLTITDPLTGLANRRRFAETLTTEWNRALRTCTPIGLAMIDIDYFKSYNDRYGHPAGDHCLCRVATALAGSVRDTDLAARYGGEEFSFILPNTDYTLALLVAERAQAAVYALKVPHEDNSAGFVTISAGVSGMAPSTSKTPSQLIDLADAALYDAKHEGRNRVLDRHRE
jgi:diguanylate cyclase (GGDEF)-like protein